MRFKADKHSSRGPSDLVSLLKGLAVAGALVGIHIQDYLSPMFTWLISVWLARKLEPGTFPGCAWTSWQVGLGGCIKCKGNHTLGNVQCRQLARCPSLIGPNLTNNESAPVSYVHFQDIYINPYLRVLRILFLGPALKIKIWRKEKKM